jgi:hypothetical protein
MKRKPASEERDHGMIRRALSTGPDSTGASEVERGTGTPTRLIATTGDVIPLVPNLVATITTFLFTMALPWACYWLIASVVGYEGLAGDIAAVFMMATLLEDAGIALGTALVLLVIGMTIQFWQHQRPFANWWPVVLAFPVSWGLLAPELLLRQSPLFVWIICTTAVPLIFSVHWLAFVTSREAME